jgi:DNA-binding transcriptional LysR family regulator
MAIDEPDWNLYRSFVHVMRAGSLSAAARLLGTTQPTVGRHIDALEAALNVTLFTRNLDGVIPTEAANRLATSMEAMASLSRTIVRTASAGATEERGTVRIAASEMIGVEVLPRVLAGLRKDHPAIAIELALSNRNEDLLHGAADIAVRMVRPQQESLIAKRLGTVGLGLFAHRDYLKAAGVPQQLADLANHVMVGFDREPAFAQLARSWGLDVRRDDFSFRSDSEHAQLAALRAGIGIGVCQLGIAKQYPMLKQVLSGKLKLSLDMWLAMHRDIGSNRRVRVVFDYLAAALSSYAHR